MPEHIALENIESTLIGLIETLRNSQEGFKQLGHRLHNNGQAKHFFLEETQRRAAYAAELENELHRMGVHDVKAGATPGGKARLLWGKVQASMAGGQKSLLSAAVEGDEAATKTYAQALRNELPLPLREMLDRQFAHIQRAHDEVRALHDLGRREA
jgi:uncharacterized protein (TIGR02284 family)